MKKVHIVLLIIVACIIMLFMTKSFKGIYFGTNNDSTASARFLYFNGEDITRVKFNKGITTVTYELDSRIGKLNFVVRDENDNIIKNLSDELGIYSFEVEEKSTYQLVIKATHSIGKYKIKY